MNNFNEVLDVTGHRYGKLTGIGRGPHSNNGRPRWVFKCDCGTEVIKKAGDVRWAHTMGGTPSCGCTPAPSTSMLAHYRVYISMVKRCHAPTDKAYPRYGGRGITVCKRWRDGGFKQFWADMGPTYKPGLTLDRKNNDRGYMPSNCRWATYHEQANNTSRSLGVDVKATASHAGVAVSTVYARIARGQKPDVPINRRQHK